MKVKNFLYKYSIVLFLIFTSFLIVSFPFQYAQEKMNSVSWPFRWLGALLFLVICTILIKYREKVIRILEKKQTFWFVLCLIILIQIFTIFAFKIQPINDLLYLHDEAIRMLKDPHISLERFHNYFGYYPNNYGYLMILYTYYKILAGIGISTKYFVLAGNFLNLVFIDAGIIFGYVILRNVKNIKMSNLWMILFLLNPWTYFWVSYYYTHTVSFGIMMAMFLLFVLTWRDRDKKKGIVWALLLGFLIYIGMKIRITNLIICVAVVMAAFFLLGKTRIKLRQITLLIAMFCGILLAVIGYSYQAGDMFPKENPQEFPATHWLMMASHGTGRYDSEDVAYTSSFSSQKEKKKMTTEQIVKNYKKLGAWKTLRLFGTKLRAVWLVGDDDFTKMTYVSSDYHYRNDYLNGQHNGWILMYSYFMRSSLWISALIGAIHLIKKRDPWEYIAMLCVLGGMVFHIFWEANPKYSICFMGMMTYLMIAGIEALGKIRIQKIEGFQKKHLIPCLITIIMILLLQPTYDYLDNDVKAFDKSYAVAQFSGNKAVNLYMRKNATIKQSFRANIGFKQITVRIQNINHVTLCLADQSGLIVETCRLKNTEYDGKEIIWKLGKFRKPGKYNIELIWNQAEGNVILPMYSTANYDAYESGYATIQGVKNKNADLLFSVSD